MLSPEDPFASLFKRTFEANYHPDIFQDKDKEGEFLPPQSPITFYDRHIAPHLTLKNVIYQPSLTSTLSRTCERTIQKYIDRGHKFCDKDYNFTLAPRGKLFHDASTTSMYYSRFAAGLSAAYAYKLVLHPERESWEFPFRLQEQRRGREYIFSTEAWLAVTNRLKNLPELMEGVDETLEGKLQGLLRNYPRLATWHMFAMTDTASTILQSVTKNTSFRWETCRTHGCTITATSNHPPGEKLSSMHTKTSTRRTRRNVSQKSAIMKSNKAVTIPTEPLKAQPYRPDFRHYIQHAWATAAEHDSTYMIFHCGRYERIGLRDRTSQTLYLSGVIDPINIKNPFYRKLQIGLWIAIVEDALERLELSGEERKGKRKCSPDDVDKTKAPKRKRTKTNSTAETIKLYDEIADRDLALLTLDYGAYLSPAPSSFLRIGPSCVPGHAESKMNPTQTRFSIHERISLVLKEPVGQGAVGIVHPAAVSVTLESGKILTRDMVIKVAFTEEQRKKMHNEYQIYSHLSCEEDLEGIVTVHGMFRDPESGAIGMLMDDAGQSLRRREIERGGDGIQVTTTLAEREAFRRALRKLHEAGVRHHDIRADNLLINSQNEVFIIDLDRADFEVSQENTDHEMDCLDDLLEGRYRDGLYYS